MTKVDAHMEHLPVYEYTWQFYTEFDTHWELTVKKYYYWQVRHLFYLRQNRQFGGQLNPTYKSVNNITMII